MNQKISGAKTANEMFPVKQSALNKEIIVHTASILCMLTSQLGTENHHVDH